MLSRELRSLDDCSLGNPSRSSTAYGHTLSARRKYFFRVPIAYVQRLRRRDCTRLSRKKRPLQMQGTIIYIPRYHPVSEHYIPLSYVYSVCYTNIRLNAAAFRRKAPALKIPKGSRRVLSAGDTLSLCSYLFRTHVRSMPNTHIILQLHGFVNAFRQ